MSYNNFLNNKTLTSADDLAEFSILDMENRDSKDYFFNNSELEKINFFAFGFITLSTNSK